MLSKGQKAKRGYGRKNIEGKRKDKAPELWTREKGD